MKPLRTLFAIFAFILLSLAANAASPAATVSAQDVTGDLLGRINALRASLGLAPYSLNGALSAAAQSQAQWMVDTLTISHSRPDGSTPTSRALAAGYPSSFVSENIYGGTLASANDAWNFWINSSIHYRGLTNAGYTEIGIGHAVGEWRTFVLVFGSQSSPYVPPANRGGGGGGGGAPQAPPSFIVGVDNFGNIMHEIQPGQTLGDIALIYGYTWDDIPAMLQLNNLTEAQIRLLPEGGILLVPPYAGTYTPTPLPPGVTLTATPEPPTSTPAEDLGILPAPASSTSSSDDAQSPTLTLLEQFNQTSTAVALQTLAAIPFVTQTPTATTTLPPPESSGRIATSAQLPAELNATQAVSDTPSPTAAVTDPSQTAVAMVVGGVGEDTPRVVIVRERQTSPWLLVAVGIQALVVVGAALEFARRTRRR